MSTNSLFSYGLFGSSQTGSDMFSGFGGIDLTTYSTIKSGTYKKLLTSYYKQQEKIESGNDETGTDSLKSDAKKVNATNIRDDAAKLKDAATALDKSKLWEKVEKKDDNGNVTSEYDKDAIYKAASSFVSNYNSLISDTAKADDNNTLTSASVMAGFTSANKNLLSQIGISVDNNNKLSIDEKKFKEADVSRIKSVFTGRNSYAQTVSSSASTIYGSAVSQIAKLSTTSLYTSSGNYSYVSGSTYNRFL